jgi:hypothetical protein
MPISVHARPVAGHRRSACLRALTCAVLASLLACTTETHAPVASVAITPTHSAIVRGASQMLAVSLFDSSQTPTLAAVTWTSSAPAVATVSESGIVSAIGYGVATISAGANGKSASAEVVVTAPPITGAYAVLDLTPVPTANWLYTYLNDSGEVLAGLLYRNGVGSAVPNCNPIALNNLSHLLCQVGPFTSFNRYELWREGVRTPLAASDTFTAGGFIAFTLNDSDVVAGVYYQPAFHNANCAASCLSIWKDGQPTFPGWSPPEYVTHLNNRLELVAQAPIPKTGEPHSAVVYDATTRQQRTVNETVKDINDHGAVVSGVEHGGHGSPLTTDAVLSRPDTTVWFGTGEATGINDAGAVVGTLAVGPFVWTSGGVSLLTKATADQGWTITNALRINNQGQILARGNHTDGRIGHWVVLTPVAR